MRCEVVKAAEFETWWRGLPEKLQDTVIAALERLRERGVLLLCHPDSTDVKSSRHGNMRELRISTRGEPIRVFYAFDPERRAVVLVGGPQWLLSARIRPPVGSQPCGAVALIATLRRPAGGGLRPSPQRFTFLA